MKRLLIPLLLLLLLVAAAVADESAGFLPPFEQGTGFVPRGGLDACVLAELEQRGIAPSHPCSDEVFVRRVYVDVIGAIPTPDEVEDFLLDRREDKRARLIDALLEREEYVDYWTLKWGDLLRVKAEFPIKLWPNGVQAYHRWIRDAVRENRPYDQFARELLTSSGSNFRVPPVNFYRAVQSKKPGDLAAAVALTFMGTRFEAWPEARQQGMAAFFSQVRFKPTAEWKEEIILDDPAPSGPVAAVFPDGQAVTIPPDVDPRRVFAGWLLAKGNPYFARAIANRVWSWLLGRGVVHEPDDLRPENPPSNPALLLYLEREMVASGYDLKHLFRAILNSRTYQGSSIPRSRHRQAEALFAHYIVRRLDAEVVIDTLCRLDGRGENYLSIVPEPFTILPDKKRSVTLRDGTITSPFLEMFGRPARDTGLESERSLEPTGAQRLHFLNSTDVQRRLDRSPWLRRLVNASRNYPPGVIRGLYVAILARDPTVDELEMLETWFEQDGRNFREAAIDLAWALLNTKEFLYRH